MEKQNSTKPNPETPDSNDIDFEELKASVIKKDCPDIMIKLCYQNTNQYLEDMPKSLNDLRKLSTDLFNIDAQNSLSLRFFYYDNHFDTIQIEHNRDLKLAYKLSLHIKSAVLKIYVWASEGDLPSYRKMYSGCPITQTASQTAASIQRMHESYNHISPQSPNALPIPKPATASTIPISNHINSIIPPNLNPNSAPTSLPISNSTQMPIQQPLPQSSNTHLPSIPSQNFKPQAQSTDKFAGLQELSNEELKTLNEIKYNILTYLKEDMNVELKQIIDRLNQTSKFLYLVESQSVFITHIFTESKKKLLELHHKLVDSKNNQQQQNGNGVDDNHQKKDDVKQIQTLRQTQFGRLRISANECEYTYLVSDFELSVLKNNQNCEQSIYIDSCFRHDQKAAINLFVYDQSVDMYMPIGHCIMQKFEKDTVKTVISWYKKEFGVFLKPKLFIIDFHYEIHQAIKEVYKNAQICVNFNRLTQKIYKDLQTYKIIEEDTITENVRNLAMSLKCLAFATPSKVKEHFDRISTEYADKFSTVKEQYDKFMNYFGETFTSNFSKIDWWNLSHAKLVLRTQLIKSCESDEGLLKLIKDIEKDKTDQENENNSENAYFLETLKTFENDIKTKLFDPKKVDMSKDMIPDAHFTQNLTILLDEDLDKVFNFEEINDTLFDSEEAIEMLGLKLQSNKPNPIIESNIETSVENES